MRRTIYLPKKIDDKAQQLIEADCRTFSSYVRRLIIQDIITKDKKWLGKIKEVKK